MDKETKKTWQAINKMIYGFHEYKDLAYWKGRVEDARSAFESNPTSLEFANALGFAREKVLNIEEKLFSA